MIHPITTFGMNVLKNKALKVEKSNPEIPSIIEDMFQTMYKSDGVGLAAPQINKSVRIFVIDATPMAEDEPDCDGFKKVFINPEIVERTGEQKWFTEGCLSVPGIREEVRRFNKIRIKYFDENWQEKDEWYENFKARVIQHEYDHLEGVLFVDHLNPLKKRIIKGKLSAITKGKVSADYRMVFASKK